MNEQAKKGEIFVCGACGKRSKDRYGEKKIDRLWDVSCMVNSVLCKESSLKIEDGRVVGADPVMEQKQKE